MTQEDKQLLLKDLCARLPYGVMCKIQTCFVFEDGTLRRGSYDKILDLDTVTEINEWKETGELEKFKPYLRPMSSMTEEEKEELKNICTMYDCDMGSDYEGFGIKILNTSRYGTEFVTDYAAIDWFNKKMFDYRGLIPMGLALEAKEGMYNI